MTDGIPPAIDEALVAALIAEVFPAWAGLDVRAVVPGGHDNRTFRLGEHLGVRLPSAEGYAAAVEKEHRWLPVLAPRLPLPIPEPVGVGRPALGYPWPWTVFRWLEGRPLGERIDDPARLAVELAGFLRALHAVDGSDGPRSGRHSFFRGGDLAVYADESRAAIAALEDRALAGWAARVLDRALRSRWTAQPVWVHGDVAAGNLLVDESAPGSPLCAVIDFGSSAVGDPACDLVPAWTVFDRRTAGVFAAEAALDDATWERAAGWALWKALITLDDPGSRRTIGRLREDVPA